MSVVLPRGETYAILNGRNLPLAVPVINKADISPFAAKTSGGDPKYGDFTLSSHQVYRDLRGGLGLQYVRPDKPNRFWESTVDTRYPYQTVLQPKSTNSANDFAFQPGNSVNEIAGVIVACPILSAGTDVIKYYNGSWNNGTGLGAGGFTYTRLVRYKIPGGSLTLFAFGTGGDTYAYSTDGIAWTVLTLSSGDADGKAFVDACVFDGKLLAVATDGNVYASAAPTTAASGGWTQATNLSAVPDTPTDIASFFDKTGQPAIYVMGTQGVWMVDYNSGEVFQILDLAGSKDAYNGIAACVHAGALYIPTIRGVLRLDSNGVAANIGPNIDDAFPGVGFSNALTAGYGYRGQVLMLQSDGLSLYAYFGSAVGSASVAGAGAILCYDGLGWHALHVIRDSALAIERRTVPSSFYKSSTRASSVSYARFWVGGYHTNLSVTLAVNYFEIPLHLENPTLDSSYVYESAGTLVTPYDDCGFAEIPKGAYQLILNYKLPSSGLCQITCEYQTNNDFGTTWTTLGPVITDYTLTTQTMYFGSSAEGISFNNIRFRFVFARGATTTDTPVINYAVLKYIPRPAPKYSFTLELDLSKEALSEAGWQGFDEFRAFMETCRASIPLLNFKEFSRAPATYQVSVTNKPEEIWPDEQPDSRGKAGQAKLVLAEPV